MSRAEVIAAALDGRWRNGRWWGLCILHRERTPSFSISEGDDGRALVHCFGGCENADLIDELRARGLWHGAALGADPEARARAERARRDRERRQARKAARDLVHVRRLFCGESVPLKGTLGEAYLEERGILIALDRVHFHPRLPRWEQGDDGKPQLAGHHPALVHLATDVHDQPLAVQRVYLRDDGLGKADLPSPRRYLGSPLGGSVRLAAAPS